MAALSTQDERLGTKVSRVSALNAYRAGAVADPDSPNPFAGLTSQIAVTLADLWEQGRRDAAAPPLD